MKLVILFLTTIISVFVLDMLWLGLIAKHIYAENIGMLLRKSGETMTPIWWAAGVVYICIALGILFFVLPKAQGSYWAALSWGIILGAVLYGVYDFTNYSILANWPWTITCIDFIWGMSLCGISSVVAAAVQHHLISSTT